MISWFVSTTRPMRESEGDVEWLLLPCATEEEAKEHASRALVRGMRIEAGTIPGIEPRVRIGGPAAHHWAQSSNAGAIKGLLRRLSEFAA
ncbi:hypothetical protein [Roseiarcus sp.]|uniref:hypothetical protein n=1 Tax=Roseiarcus sp. TaxID=1969460 RepID=UPI003C37E988